MESQQEALVTQQKTAYSKYNPIVYVRVKFSFIWYKTKQIPFRIADWIYSFEKSNFANFVETECRFAGLYNKDSAYGGLIPDALIKLARVHSREGHSGYSHSLVGTLFGKLVKGDLLSPLMNTPEEWLWHDKDMAQGKRCGAMFQDVNKRPYYLDAIVWKGERPGDTFIGTVEGITSRQYIKKFPFIPKTFYIDVVRIPYYKGNHSVSDAISGINADYIYKIKDKMQLDKVWEVYDRYEDNLKDKEEL